MFGDCERCGQRDARDTKLFGSVSARLCVKCRREWDTDEYIRSLCLDYSLNEVKLLASIQAGQQELAAQFVETCLTIRDKGKDHAVGWLSQKIEED